MIMPFVSYNSGDRVELPDGTVRVVAFTGNGGWVYFYGPRPGECEHTSKLKPAVVKSAKDA